MEFGVHLPLLAFRGQSFSLSRLVDYAEAAQQLGFTTLCANDHLTFSRPWLDSITALAAILTKTHHVTLMTTVVLPVIRGPVPLAKSLAALDVLSGGHLIAGHVRPTLELVVDEVPAHLRRRYDPESGLALINLDRPGERQLPRRGK